MKFRKRFFTEGKLELLDEIFAADYVSRHPTAPGPLHGPEEVKEWLSMILNAFSTIDVTIEDVIAEDDKVVQRRLFTGTLNGECMGIDASGKEVEMQSIVILWFEDGKIVES